MDNMQRVDLWLGFVAAVIGAVWKVVAMIFGLRKRVDDNTKDIEVLRKATKERMDHGSKEMTGLRNDIRDLGDRTEGRHDKIENKLDQLIMNKNGGH